MPTTTQANVNILLVFSTQPDRGALQAFEEDWYMRGPSEVPLTFHWQEGKRAEWSAALQEAHFDAVGELCEHWLSQGRIKKASLIEDSPAGLGRRWNLGPSRTST
ncbi:MAG: hypothetical protein M1818_002963 [Claussenomyces sp. TS43310]|nr:MAG: hypothetical protein M1818_002963 [Claussenomyces sp. TS43310]